MAIRTGHGRADLRREDPGFGHRYSNGTVHPVLAWPYLLGFQVAGLNEEADRILNAMIDSAEEGTFSERDRQRRANISPWTASPAGYEGYLSENWNFLMAAFTRDPKQRERVIGLFGDV